ncbi:MAG: hypothetical protein MZV49_13480 [Rhodopseudomonas palustris]|nr:hypothetical protein [Rhodopseudomonas palustris]
MKLAHALDAFVIAVDGRVCADIGSSTGGFTDLYPEGAVQEKSSRWISGTNQLEYVLRSDPRVVVMENTNARYLKANDFE